MSGLTRVGRFALPLLGMASIACSDSQPRLSVADSTAVAQWQGCTECQNGELARVLQIGAAAIPRFAEAFDSSSAGDPTLTDYDGRLRLSRLAGRQMRSASALGELGARGMDAARDSLLAIQQRFQTVPQRADVVQTVADAIAAAQQPPAVAITGLIDMVTGALSVALTVDVIGPGGAAIPTAPVTWEIDDPTIAVFTELVGHNATLTRVAPQGGVVRVTATSGAASADALIEFQP